MRVIPLAFGAVVATCASMAVASGILRNATERPGVDIIVDELKELHRAAATAVK